MISGDVSDIIINGKQLKLYSLTGIVSDTDTSSDTEARGIGGGGVPNVHPGSVQSSPVHFKVETSKTRYQNISLIDENEQEHHFYLVDFLVSCRKGSLLSFIWGIRNGKKQGQYFAAYNHNTQEVFYDDAILCLFYRPKLLALILYPVMMIIGVTLGILIANYITRGMTGAGAMIIPYVIGLIGALVGIRAGWYTLKAIMKKIIRKFKASKSWLSVLERLQAIQKDKFKPLEANYMTSDSSVYVDDSFIHGKGLFAKYFIPSGAVIGLVQGQPTTEDGDYVLWTDETNGIHVHCDLRYINHSDDPNAVYYDNLEVCAMRDIQAGEEITHNYRAGWEE